jgi:hypothetical protein
LRQTVGGKDTSELYQSLSHSKWDCKYHVVFVPKYRRKVMFKEIRQYLGPIPEQWAMIQNNLSTPYFLKGIGGELGDNVEAAIIAAELALQIFA